MFPGLPLAPAGVFTWLILNDSLSEWSNAYIPWGSLLAQWVVPWGHIITLIDSEHKLERAEIFLSTDTRLPSNCSSLVDGISQTSCTHTHTGTQLAFSWNFLLGLFHFGGVFSFPAFSFGSSKVGFEEGFATFRWHHEQLNNSYERVTGTSWVVEKDLIETSVRA